MALALASAEVGDGEEPEADGPSLFVFGE
jgi:hypothetical protein